MTRSPRSFAWFAWFIVAILHAAPGSAAPPLVTLDDRSESPAMTQPSAATCLMEPGPIQTSTSYFWTSPDAYSDVAWLIPSCASCAPGSALELKTLSFRVRWFGACTAHATVSVVGATGPEGCPVPDVNTVLHAPVSYTISGSTGTIHTLTLPAGWCISSPAFVLVHFLDLGSCYATGSSPGITRTSAACENCTQYVSTTVSTPTITDWCSQATNSLWLQIEAECCTAVGVDGGRHPSHTRIAVLGAPSPRVRVRIDLAGTERRPVRLDVFDISGRRVRTLLSAESEGGSRVVEWDGTSDSGARLSAGLYKVRLQAGGERASVSALLLD